MGCSESAEEQVNAQCLCVVSDYKFIYPRFQRRKARRREESDVDRILAEERLKMRTEYTVLLFGLPNAGKSTVLRRLHFGYLDALRKHIHNADQKVPTSTSDENVVSAPTPVIHERILGVMRHLAYHFLSGSTLSASVAAPGRNELEMMSELTSRFLEDNKLTVASAELIKELWTSHSFKELFTLRCKQAHSYDHLKNVQREKARQRARLVSYPAVLKLVTELATNNISGIAKIILSYSDLGMEAQLDVPDSWFDSARYFLDQKTALTEVNVWGCVPLFLSRFYRYLVGEQ
jgi:hypothetical protein